MAYEKRIRYLAVDFRENMMLRLVVAALLLLAAHFSLTAFVPATAGKAWIAWPFAADSRPILAGVGGLPQQGGSVLTPLLAGAAGLCFLLALAALLGWAVPAEWWVPLIVVGVIASVTLHVLYLGSNSLLPIAIDLSILWGVLIQHWSVAGLNAS